MRKLNYELIQICKRSKDGSYSTQENRKKILLLMANQLNDLGYRNMIPKSLKPKHVDALVKQWNQEGLSAGTIKNRMTVVRWWANKVGKPTVVSHDNDHYGIDRRQYVTNEDKSTSLDRVKLDRVHDPHVKMSLKLQEAFGLRREESIKIMPGWADRTTHIVLKSTWTKGGKERSIPITNQAQRDILGEAKKMVGAGALIPNGKNYVEQLRTYEYQTAKSGLSKMHGLRHRYAQERYFELTGKKSVAAGGVPPQTDEEKNKDYEARKAISFIMGHYREQVTAVYLGFFNER